MIDFLLVSFGAYLKTLKKIIFEREIKCEQERGRERETQNPKKAPGSELSAQSPMQGSNPRTMRS